MSDNKPPSALASNSAKALSSILNPQQLEAVRTTEGAVLILAGAGSGKTRVITHRIAYLLELGVPSSEILAVTFTNKAAREMSQRIHALCRRGSGNLAIRTFHAFGVRVLREFGSELGYRKNFTIYDEADKQRLIREAARELGLTRTKSEGEADLDSVMASHLFSCLKTGRADWDDMTEQYRGLYDEYLQRLKLFNAVDFDDLIVQPLRILKESKSIREIYLERYRYFLVDEFQDTSERQYELLHVLAGESGNICVVGDDDQSIYSWRGANFGNLTRFEKDFPKVKEIKLEQNYRSRRNILQLANHLIVKNKSRKPKQLWSDLEQGDPIWLSFPEDEKQEGELIAEIIKSLMWKKKIPHNGFGVLVRANSLTRAIEEAFVRNGLPYKISGGMSFFQRKEVKDILAYLKVMANPDDDMNLLRIINRPRRGIGMKTLEVMVSTSQRERCSLYSGAAALIHAADSPLSDKAMTALSEFVELVETYKGRFENRRNMAATLSELIAELDIWGYLVQENRRGTVARWKYTNVEGVVDSIAAYKAVPENLDKSLQDYLMRIGLVTRDDIQDEDGRKEINLMTIHAAKGLEFDVVFIAGVEKDMLPHVRALTEDESSLEEERRLFYVAVTRAKRDLFISACRMRRRRGELFESGPSPFLKELPQELLQLREEEEEKVSAQEAGGLFDAVKKSLPPV